MELRTRSLSSLALTFFIGLGQFAHCVAGSGEVLVAVLTHQVFWSAYLRWLAIALSDNVCGGIVVVTLLRYGQVILDSRGEKAVAGDTAQHDSK